MRWSNRTLKDKYLPSYLVLAHDGGEAFHILFATDVAEKNVCVVIAPFPTLYGANG
jgi:hypothetical protein